MFVLVIHVDNPAETKNIFYISHTDTLYELVLLQRASKTLACRGEGLPSRTHRLVRHGSECVAHSEHLLACPSCTKPGCNKKLKRHTFQCLRAMVSRRKSIAVGTLQLIQWMVGPCKCQSHLLELHPYYRQYMQDRSKDSAPRFWARFRG